MAEYMFDPAHSAFVKECYRCEIVFVGAKDQDESERIFTKHFAQDRATRDGFYARCRKCVSEAQRRNRGGRECDPDELLKLQNGNCGICEKEISFERSSNIQAKVLAYIDHNHETNKVRGILCPMCNSRLGMVENKEWLAKALDYLKKFEE